MNTMDERRRPSNLNEVPRLFDETCSPDTSKALMLRPVKVVRMISCGLIVSRSLKAPEALSTEGMSARVVEMDTVKPLDEDSILQAARESGALVTAEENGAIGGLTRAGAETVVEHLPVPLRQVGLSCSSAETGPCEAILGESVLMVQAVAATARQAMAAKKWAPYRWPLRLY